MVTVQKDLGVEKPHVSCDSVTLVRYYNTETGARIDSAIVKLGEELLVGRLLYYEEERHFVERLPERWPIARQYEPNGFYTVRVRLEKGNFQLVTDARTQETRESGSHHYKYNRWGLK